MVYHNYIFLTSEKSINDLPKDKLEEYKKTFIQTLQNSREVICYSYTTLGLKANTQILLWLQADSLPVIQDHLNQLLQTKLGRYLRITYTLLGMSRPTQYAQGSVNHLDTSRKGGPYLIIYPFTKTTSWHILDFEKRKTLMKGHIAVGKNYPQITQLLLYSYGVDDSEFIVSYETDNLLEFQKLVMDLRNDKVRAYTQNDTPIFTCIYRPIEETINYL